ncbi:MAG: thymidylate kinase [Oscillospiraceae bacterium]|nr:thymidylate kinase [Oscillospiraceae bacterium]
MKVIVFEGIDGCGKKTQARLLIEFLRGQGKRVCHLDFPAYDSPSSSLVKMYLNGEFGENAAAINAYSASSFYAVDRVATFAKVNLADFDYVICDRYTTSNAIHQASKLENGARDEFLHWLFDYEHNLLGIPRPDKVILLDVNPATAKKISAGRALKSGKERDIHESDFGYLQKCYECAIACAAEFGWQMINCEKAGEILPTEDIHVQIIKSLQMEGLL